MYKLKHRLRHYGCSDDRDVYINDKEYSEFSGRQIFRLGCASSPAAVE